MGLHEQVKKREDTLRCAKKLQEEWTATVAKQESELEELKKELAEDEAFKEERIMLQYLTSLGWEMSYYANQPGPVARARALKVCTRNPDRMPDGLLTTDRRYTQTTLNVRHSCYEVLLTAAKAWKGTQ